MPQMANKNLKYFFLKAWRGKTTDMTEELRFPKEPTSETEAEHLKEMFMR